MAFSFGGKSYDPRPPRIRKPKAPKGVFSATSLAGPSRARQPQVASYVQPGPDESYKDQTYFDTTSGISRNLDNLRAYTVDAGKNIGTDYGIDYTGDPVNGAANFTIAPDVDVTNPFSRAALLKRSYQQATAGNTNSMAARGQLYSGALQRAQNETGRQNLQAQDSLIKDFASRFGGLYQNWLAGQNQATTDSVGAQTAAIDRHINDPAPALAPAVGKTATTTAPTGWRDIAYKDTAAAGLKVEVGNDGLVVKDSQGNVIKGARVMVVGKRRFIRVPR